VEFQLDDRNLKHLISDHPDRLVTEQILDEVISNHPRAFPNEANTGRTASHKVIGPDDSGRFWTFAALYIDGNIWRPITGWPSTNTERRLHEEMSDG